MAEPQRKSSAHPAHVASCSATDCVHNEDRECHADEINVDMKGDGHAICTTYKTELPKARP